MFLLLILLQNSHTYIHKYIHIIYIYIHIPVPWNVWERSSAHPSLICHNSLACVCFQLREEGSRKKRNVVLWGDIPSIPCAFVGCCCCWRRSQCKNHVLRFWYLRCKTLLCFVGLRYVCKLYPGHIYKILQVHLRGSQIHNNGPRTK